MDIKNQISFLNQKASFEYQMASKYAVSYLETLIKNLIELKEETAKRVEDGSNLDKTFAKLAREATNDFNSFIRDIENGQNYASDLQQTRAQLEILRQIRDKEIE